MKAFRLGVIGVGRRGLALAEYSRKVPSLELISIADPAVERLSESMSLLPGVRGYESHREMLETENLDIVIVATLGVHHRVPAVDAAASGVRGIFVEKPLATSLADCDAIIDACAQNSVKLAVGHQRRWWPEYQRVREAIRAGEIGAVRHGYAFWPTGRVGTYGTHQFDTLQMLLGLQAAWVTGACDPESKPLPQWPEIVDPGVMGTVVYEDGTRIMIEAMDDVRQPDGFMFFGSRGRLFLFEDASRIEYRARENSPIDAFDSWDPMKRRAFRRPRSRKHVEWHGVPEGLRDLLGSVEAGREPLSTGEHARQSLEVIIGFHLSSARDMRPVHFPLEGADREYDANFR